MAVEPTSQSTLSIALQGLNKSMNRIAENASKVAGYGTEANAKGDLVTPLVEIKQDINQIEALTKVIKVTEELDDAVLSIIA